MQGATFNVAGTGRGSRSAVHGAPPGVPSFRSSALSRIPPGFPSLRLLLSPLFAAFLLLPCLAAVLSSLPSPAHSATPDSFRTPEYLANYGALDWINAAEAYAAGYTGKGVTIAITDSNAYPQHREFAGKSYVPVWFGYNPHELDHGVHVAGISAANRDGLEMHGVAFDADILGIVLAFTDEEGFINAILSLLDHPEVSVANASWGNIWSLADGAKGDYEQLPAEETVVKALAKVANERDILFVFAAANQGISSPSISANAPAVILGTKLIGQTSNIPIQYDFESLTDSEKRALSLNIISVSSFIPSAESTGSIAFTSYSTSLADGATDFSLMAPGVNIWSATADSPTSYDWMTGTSMAAPYVTGVAALVQEAFPFLGGKQIADVLLSTARPLAATAGEIATSTPPFIFQYGAYGTNFTVRESAVKALDGKPWSSMLVGREKEMETLWHALYDHIADPPPLDVFIARIAERLDAAQTKSNNAPYDLSNPVTVGSAVVYGHVVSDEEFVKLFGMGIVDAGKAVKGPGWLDAHSSGTATRRHTPKAMARLRTRCTPWTPRDTMPSGATTSRRSAWAVATRRGRGTTPIPATPSAPRSLRAARPTPTTGNLSSSTSASSRRGRAR
jgi:subtilase-type serine protease